MSELIQFRNSLPLAFVAHAREKAEKILSDVHAEYFAKTPMQEFRALYQKESLVSRVITFRFFSQEFLEQLRSHVVPKLEALVERKERFSLCPYFYLRFCWPDVHLSEKHRAAYLYTEPHYDISLGVDGFSNWIPFENVDRETGGLCYFKDAEILRRIPRSPRNLYSIGRYLDDAAHVDPHLTGKEIQPEIAVGDFFTFDTNTLHGATKPRTKRRLSLNFRFIPYSQLERASETTRKLCQNVDEQLDLCNAINLASLGDHSGAGAYLDKTPQNRRDSELYRLACELTDRNFHKAGEASLAAGRKLHWTDEYRWASSEGKARAE